MKFLPLTTLLFATHIFAGSFVSATPEAEKLPAWTPDTALANGLAAPAALKLGSIRPPKGYAPRQEQTEGAVVQAWVGGPDENEIHPWIMVSRITPPAGEDNKITLLQLLDKFLGKVKDKRIDWKRTATETGAINGLKFVRARWSGTEPLSEQKMHGFIYLAKIGKEFIEIRSQVPDTHPETLKLTEASAQTFKVAGG